MKKRILTLIAAIALLAAVAPTADATSIRVDGAPASIPLLIYNQTTYVPIRAASHLLVPWASVSWELGQAVVRTADLTVTARPGDCYISANGRALYAKDGVKAENGSVLVPIRALAKAAGALVTWQQSSDTVEVRSGSGTLLPGDQFYDSSAVYWLSRIISSESSAEPLAGKIAVGNVVLNRVSHPDFPDTIYDVIFDRRWGGQFEPVDNGTIHHMPTEESVLAAKLCLDGASVAGESLYFLNPAKSKALWAVKNRGYVATIGNHQFFS